MRLSLLLAFLFTSTVALAADRQINQISVEQSDSDTIIRLFGSDLIRSPKDRVFFAAEASSYSVEPTMMYGDSEYVEVALGMPVMAGQYRISIGPNENTSTLESMVVIGAIGPQGPAGRDGADGRDGVDGMDGSPGADGQDGMDGADGVDGAKGDPGADGKDGSSCSVTQTISGATLSCTDGTMASIANGADGVIGSNGTDGADGQDGENGADGSSCSVEEIDGGAVVSCTDGTSAVLAGAGSEIYVQSTPLSPSTSLIPDGDIVLVDAGDEILGLVRNDSSRGNYCCLLEIPYEINEQRYSEELRIKFDEETLIPAPFTGVMDILYTTDDCTGQEFGFSIYVRTAFEDGALRFFVRDWSRDQSKVLFKSYKPSASDSPQSCVEKTQAVQASPLIEVPFEKFEEATLPVRIEQLPL